jgi:hypothetical protein
MSYLKVPRLVFSGKFSADVPTVNNESGHYNSDDFRTRYHMPGEANGLWNPNGGGAFRLSDCIVKRVDYLDGSYCDDPLKDPVIGLPLSSTDSRASAKMVDLDPSQQITEIWGLQLTLGDSNAAAIRADYDPAPFYDMWRRAAGMNDAASSSSYQSYLTLTQWENNIGSRFLQELEQASGGKAEKLSIKFNVDGFNIDMNSPEFTFGRIVGAIGVYEAQEPAYFIAGRALYPQSDLPVNFGIAYCRIENNIAYVDAGNTFSTGEGGAIQPLGPFALTVIDEEGRPQILGEIKYADPGFYEASAGVVAVPFAPELATLVASRPLAFLHLPSNIIALRENEDGIFIRADKTIFRFNPHEQASTKIFATCFGQPLSGQVLKLNYDPTYRLGEPRSALTFPNTVTTNAAGIAEVLLTAGDPGNPRAFVDGQTYVINYWTDATAYASALNKRGLITARVFSGYTVPDDPTWMEHVHPIFRQYAELYPVMKPIVDLSNYASVIQRLHIIRNVFQLPVTSPNYMPVTRDLSAAKLAMIRKWLDNPLYMTLNTVENMKYALQMAIELEHSTIPPYLYALYSIKPDCNAVVAGLIRSVVTEEMLHMTLVSNILIAIGGSPDLVHSRFVPDYPGSMPGGLRADLTVRLRRCSIEHIRDTFMVIEEPEEIIQTKMKAKPSSWPHEQNLYTVGWFYDEIKKGLTQLSRDGKITFGHTEKQVIEWGGNVKIDKITRLKDALDAIEKIKDQGEGANAHDPSDGDGELAHYYRFSEIVHGAHLTVKEGKFSYTGEVISFDQEGVWPVTDDPQPITYPEGSRAKLLSAQFAESYQAMLKGLNRAFNGEPAFIQEAVGTMYTLSLLARQLMQTPSGLNDGTTAGPAFQLP